MKTNAAIEWIDFDFYVDGNFIISACYAYVLGYY